MTGISQTEFAKRLGVTRGYIAQLKKEGRLVFTSSGKVDEIKSKQMIEDTKDPSKQGVVDRHAQERTQLPAVIEAKRSDYQQARAMKEEFNAKLAKMAYEKEIGKLLDANEVRLAIMDGDAIIRNRLESLPDILAPQLATVPDEHKIRSMLIDHINLILSELSQTFRAKYD